MIRTMARLAFLAASAGGALLSGSAGAQVDIHDPWVDAKEAAHEYSLEMTAQPQAGAYDAVILAVAHRQFLELGAAGIRALGRSKAILYDVKSLLPRAAVDGRL